VPNTGLEPETVVTYDGGIKYDSDLVSAEAFGFYSDYDDKIEEVPTGDTTEDGRVVVQSANLNSVKLYGAEVGAHVRPTSEIELFGSLNYTIADETFQDGTEGPADRIPPLNGRVGVSFRPIPPVWVELFLLWAGRQDRLSVRDAIDPRIDPRGTDGWVTANVRATWQVHEHLLARVALENIADEAYREHGSGIDAAGINAIVGLEARF
jgi:outer membrane receptor protein involved in Fe transport